MYNMLWTVQAALPGENQLETSRHLISSSPLSILFPDYTRFRSKFRRGRFGTRHSTNAECQSIGKIL